MPQTQDPQIAARMLDALQRAARALGCALPDDGGRTWGWEGRSLSSKVHYDGHPHWLRVTSLPLAKAPQRDIIPAPEDPWSGPEDAAWRVPVKVPRPTFAAMHRWNRGGHVYHADLHRHAQGRPLSETALPPKGLRPDDRWWRQLSVALTDISLVQTQRVAVRAERLSWAMPHFLGDKAPTQPPSWTTAHGDLQWSNLIGPRLEILDWERWGVAPEGYDIATLYVSSLGDPELADQILDRFSTPLNSPSGRFSQLYAASEFIQGFERGNNREIEHAVRNLVAQLL